MNKDEHKAHRREYYHKNRERIRAQQKIGRQKKSASGYTMNRKNNLKQKFGLTIEDYERMLKAQDGVCAICSKGEVITYEGRIRDLAVDHCHKTGKVRRLLCSTCNNGLGCFKDDPQLLVYAVEYLIKHQQEERE